MLEVKNLKKSFDNNKVLKGIDFDAVRINVLTIENNPPCCAIYGDENIRKLMFENNFILWGRTIGLDDIFVHKDFLDQNSMQELLLFSHSQANRAKT